MDPLVLAAGTALVSAMATDAWKQVRAAMIALWHRARPDQVETIEKDLTGLHEQASDSCQSGDTETGRDLAASWQARLQELLREDPSLARELKRILDEELTPALREAGQTQISSTTMRATARDQGKVFQAGRDQHITGQ